ncbi:MAG TPA: hypothetical protein VHU14_07025 [Solirubrobacterales bacterium]|jgi:hypothetical protein|nr:hypothetical protein [Solirubrobacterales bacterium]
MHPARHISPCRRRAGASLGLALLALALVGCSSGDTNTQARSSLLSGTRGGPLAAMQLAPAAHLARRFAFAYARSIYRRRPPRLPGTTAALRRDLAAAASRVPPARRGLHPRALAVTLRPQGAAALAGVVKIGDGRSPPFAVGFIVRKRGSRWRVVTISPPS